MHTHTQDGHPPAGAGEPAGVPAAGAGVIHPRSLICDRCGSGMNWTRFVSEGKRCRKYYCPECGLTQVFIRQRISPAPGE